jgi:hypothetical protein
MGTYCGAHLHDASFPIIRMPEGFCYIKSTPSPKVLRIERIKCRLLYYRVVLFSNTALRHQQVEIENKLRYIW